MKTKENFEDNHGHNIWRIFFFQNFLSPQVKGSTIISNKYGICELLIELPDD